MTVAFTAPCINISTTTLLLYITLWHLSGHIILLRPPVTAGGDYALGPLRLYDCLSDSTQDYYSSVNVMSPFH